MTPKPRWDRVGSPSALAHYVPRGLDRFLPAHLTRDLPTATGSQLGRAKAVFSVLARAGITYGHEPSSSAPGRQVIREPSEVLAGPRHGTCLDLAVLYAGACLDAGLHPAVLVADPTRPTDPAHAIVLVWTGGDWRGRPTREDPFVDLGDGRGVWHSVADAVLDTIRAGSDQPGSVLAVDVSLVAYGSPGRDAQNDTDALWESALARGASLVADGARQKLGIDIGRTYDREDAFTVLAAPPQEPLGPPYTTERPDAEIGPLEAVKARAGIVPFCPRDELDALREWFEAPAKDPTDLVRAAVVHGVGGSGKTRLAAQLSEQLNREGWYAGFARRIPSIGGLEYLTRLACPVLVIIDYPEGIPEESLATLLSAIAGRRDPTGLLFTSRADGITAGQWWTRTSAIAEDAGLDLKGIRSLALSERHHAPAQVYQAALAEFSRRANQEPPTLVVPPEPPRIGNWTTLDLVMLAWLAVRHDGMAPASRADLYEEVLDHEFRYWGRTYRRERGEELIPELRRPVGAALTLLQPDPSQALDVLTALPRLAHDVGRASGLVDVLSRLLRDTTVDSGGAGEALAIRPDPVGDHLLMSVLASDPGFATMLLTTPPDEPHGPADTVRKMTFRLSPEARFTACAVLARAAQWHASAAEAAADRLLHDLPEIWEPALQVAMRVGGPFVYALESAAADAARVDLPWHEIDAMIPSGHTALRNLAYLASQAAVEESEQPNTDAGRAHHAGLLNNLGVRLAEAGRRTEALDPTQEAVTIYRDLAQANPAAYANDLAMSLNNLGNQLAEAGRRTEALDPTQEAVTIYRDLAQANPAAYANDLASSLNNLGNRLAEVGGLETEAFIAALEGLPTGLTAWLLGHRALWASQVAPGMVTDAMGRAIQLASSPDPDEDAMWLGSVRRDLRQLWSTLTEQGCTLPAGSPDWVAAFWPDAAVDVVNAWLSATDWSRKADALTAAAALPTGDRRSAFELLCQLYPNLAQPIAQLDELVDEADRVGLDTLLSDLGKTARHREAVEAWLGTRTWDESRHALRNAPNLAEDPRTREFLSALAADSGLDVNTRMMARQHLAILDLACQADADRDATTEECLDKAYEIVTDPDTATDAAWQAAIDAEEAKLAAVMMAAPALLGKPFTAPALSAILTLLRQQAGPPAQEPDETWSPRTLIAEAAAEGTPTQRQALSNRLRRLARRRTDLSEEVEILLTLLGQE